MEEDSRVSGGARAAGKGTRARELAHQLAMRELQNLKGSTAAPAAESPAADPGVAAEGKKGKARGRGKSSSWESVPMMIPTTAALASAYGAVAENPIALDTPQESATEALQQQQAEARAAAAVSATANSFSAAVDPPAPASAVNEAPVVEEAVGTVVGVPQLEDIEAAMHEDEGEADAAFSAEDEKPDVALGVFDHLDLDLPTPADATTEAAAVAVEAVGVAAPDQEVLSAAGVAELVDIEAAMHEDEGESDAAYNSEDEKPDLVLDVFDHLSFDPPAAAAAAIPQLSDIAAAMHEDEGEAEAAYSLEDEKPDVALDAFDHIDLGAPAAAGAAAAVPGVALPEIADIAAAMHEDEGEIDAAYASEDEKADAALDAFDHLELSAAAVAAAAPADVVAVAPTDGPKGMPDAEQKPAAGTAAALGVAAQPSVPSPGSVSASMSNQVVVPTAAATAEAARGVVGSNQADTNNSTSGGDGNLMVMMQKWWQSIVDMFGDWGSKLSK
jgi:hypothetical protein